MNAGCDNGNLLQSNYCNTYESWKTGGPPGTEYNRSTSGCFEMQTFENWFETVALPHLKNLNAKETIVVDNSIMHSSAEVIKQCEENYIAFVFFTTRFNSYPLPSRCIFVRFLKQAWRNILAEEKS